MQQDDRVRDKFAIGISIREEEARVELILDDLELIQGTSPPRWRQWAYFTYFGLDPKSFEESELSEKQFAAIGRAVVVRLNALRYVTARSTETS